MTGKTNRACLQFVYGIVLVLDEEGEVVFVNQRGCEMLGYRGEEVVGKNWTNNFVSGRFRGRIARIFEKLTNDVVEGEVRPRKYSGPLLTKDGGEKFFSWESIPLVDEQGQVIGLLSVGREMGEQEGEETIPRERFNEIRNAATELLLSKIYSPEGGRAAGILRGEFGKSLDLIDTCIDILKAAGKGLSKTRLVSKANLTFPRLERYLDLLVEEGLLEARPGPHPVYSVSEKGWKFLEKYEELKNFMASGGKSSPSLHPPTA